MYKPYKPNERIVDRAVWIWGQMLDSEGNARYEIEKFSFELRRKLLVEVEPMDAIGRAFYNTILLIDQGEPCVPLVESETWAGVRLKWPEHFKTELAEGWVCARILDANSPAIYHYPLSDNRWLVTALYGDDIGKIIALVESGVLSLDLTATER